MAATSEGLLPFSKEKKKAKRKPLRWPQWQSCTPSTARLGWLLRKPLAQVPSPGQPDPQRLHTPMLGEGAGQGCRPGANVDLAGQCQAAVTPPIWGDRLQAAGAQQVGIWVGKRAPGREGRLLVGSDLSQPRGAVSLAVPGCPPVEREDFSRCLPCGMMVL